ncbi:MAG: hypothetical protein M3406_10275 [Chloroflexota bacterium]|nr:hypothetical protein [Chloroflexota bacterium]
MRRALLVLASLSLLLAAMASPVAGRERSMSRGSGQNVNFNWLQIDRDPATGLRYEPGDPNRPFGNVHIGFMYIEQRTRSTGFAQGFIADLDCPTDYEPPFGGGHGAPGVTAFEEPPPEPENPCTHLGQRDARGEVPLTIGRKLISAHIGGAGVFLPIYGGGHEAGPAPIGQAPINITVIGGSALQTYTSEDTYEDEYGFWTYSQTTTFRTGTVTEDSILGPMRFPAGYSSAQISEYKYFSRSRSQ